MLRNTRVDMFDINLHFNNQPVHNKHNKKLNEQNKLYKMIQQHPHQF